MTEERQMVHSIRYRRPKLPRSVTTHFLDSLFENFIPTDHSVRQAPSIVSHCSVVCSFIGILSLQWFLSINTIILTSRNPIYSAFSPSSLHSSRRSIPNPALSPEHRAWLEPGHTPINRIRTARASLINVRFCDPSGYLVRIRIEQGSRAEHRLLARIQVKVLIYQLYLSLIHASPRWTYAY